MKKFISIIVLWSLGQYLNAQNPTWENGIASIVYNNCTKCHNQNGIGPFPLESYAQALPYASNIKVAVNTKRMPPWPPDRAYSSFAHERILTSQQIQDIVDWVDAGSPSGDLSQAPTAPSFGAYELSDYDIELKIPDFQVNTTNDLYRCFVIPVNNASSRFIKDIEVIPGDRSIVHHVLVFQDPSNTPINLDNNDPGPGYTSFGSTGSNASKLISGWVPGSKTIRYPNQMGPKLDPQTNIVLQIHYPGGTFNGLDSTKIRIKYHPTSVREVIIEPAINHFNLDNGPLFIPADSTKWFYAQYQVPQNYTLSLLSLAPHMHLIGRKIKVWAETPAQDTIPLIKIDRWNFHWQGFYSYKNLLKIPGGSIIKAEALYDNTTANHHNPNSPPLPVSAGESTTDEMMIVYFTVSKYQNGDENISQEYPSSPVSIQEDPSSFIKGIQLLDIYPNPASDFIYFNIITPNFGQMKYQIFDINGALILKGNQVLNQGFFQNQIDIHSLTSGSYTLEIEQNGTRKSKRFIKL